MDFLNQLDNLLAVTYNTIQRVEEKKVKKNYHLNLTISELHLMEQIGTDNEEGRSISDIAAALNYTMPSITVAVNKLEAKGYVVKTKVPGDKRVVFVKLSEAGKKVNGVHHYIHRRMSREVAKELTEEEQQVLLKSLRILNDIFQKSLD